MRIAFFLVVLTGAIFYSYVAFADLGFLSRTGRLGPGFFPRIIGVAAIVMTLWALVDELRARRGPGGAFEQWRDVAVLIAFALGYAVLLRLFGGFVATFLFLLLTLSVLNPGRRLTNGLVAVIVPGVVYLLFDQLLNANMPPALIDLPI
ncbi:tripartite tricarboxylate transporter TctB family protein [Rubrimonas cliftonensis]|uniref:Tripartite tricarboxylate transporter TctB family protein n=1 Tax=Rubrimonas cliftonensis TaxID=89524 RepID=A0A1H3XAS2_9RHOB|nr:tripartite tricarboxylate transporter TctB family protein [Rubrimonas cliftonensis]SDZ96496.1 Tripartite tricarboxylate transporter TctB family protein [Rubrimonas cliftonensis]